MTHAGEVRISGAPTASEVAAVVAALRAGEAAASTIKRLSGYERWRRCRQQALRRAI